MRMLAGIVFWAMALGFLGFWLLPRFQRSLTFYPSREFSAVLERAAEAAGWERWRDGDGRGIGWRMRRSEEGWPLVIFHGNAGYALHRVWLADWLRKAAPPGRPPGIHILEYPGYGDRPGSPSEAALTQAAYEALATLPEAAVIVGESLGTGVAAQVAARRPGDVRGLILLTPFDSLVSVAAHHYPFLPVRLLMADRMDSVAALRGLRAPAAFVVAGEDEITPAASGLRLYETYGGPKRLWMVPGARHNDAAAMLSAQDWKDILELACSGSAKATPSL